VLPFWIERGAEGRRGPDEGEARDGMESDG
jgi:hypothetical protein